MGSVPKLTQRWTSLCRMATLATLVLLGTASSVTAGEPVAPADGAILNEKTLWRVRVVR